MSAALVPDARDRILALRAALAATAVAGAAALVVALVDPAGARGRLDFGFAGVPDTLEELRTILGHNLRLTVAAVGGAAALELTRSFARAGRAIRLLLDVVVAASVLLNAGIVGVALGAYGGRMVTAMLPHGPIEVAGFAVALALYLRARRTPVRPAHGAMLVAWAVGLLTIAAVVETYAS